MKFSLENFILRSSQRERSRTFSCSNPDASVGVPTLRRDYCFYLIIESSWNPMIIFCLLVYPEHSLAECWRACFVCVFLPILWLCIAYNCIFSFQSSSEDFHNSFSVHIATPKFTKWTKAGLRHAYSAPRVELRRPTQERWSEQYSHPPHEVKAGAGDVI